jgi:hypothetical protein
MTLPVVTVNKLFKLIKLKNCFKKGSEAEGNDRDLNARLKI